MIEKKNKNCGNCGHVKDHQNFKRIIFHADPDKSFKPACQENEILCSLRGSILKIEKKSNYCYHWREKNAKNED